MLKVLYVAPDYPNKNKSAAQVRANQLLPRLNKYVDLSVFAYSQLENTTEQVRGKNSVSIIKPHQPGFASIFSPKPRAFFRYMHTEAKKKFKHILTEIAPNIVHFDSIATFGLCDCLPKDNIKKFPKVIFHPHDAVSKLYASQIGSQKNIPLWLYLKSQQKKILTVEKNVYSKGDLILVDSPEDANFLTSIGKRANVQVLPLGYDETVFFPEKAMSTFQHPNVLFSGAMGGVQSVEAALRLYERIMPLIWEVNPKVHLYLVGSSPAPEVLALQQDARIHVTGFVDDLATLLRSCDVYVCPLTLGSGMRTRTIEALACGCAMVSSAEGVVGVKQHDTAWAIAESDLDFATQIMQIIQNKDIADNISKNAVTTAAQYSWSTVASQLNHFYESV